MDFRIAEIKTPLVLQAWKEKLARYPDREYADYILKGVEEGFRTGVDSRRSMTSSRRNMLSAQQHPIHPQASSLHNCQLSLFQRDSLTF